MSETTGNQRSLGDVLASVGERLAALPSAVPRAENLDWIDAIEAHGDRHVAFRLGERLCVSDLDGLVETMPAPRTTFVPGREEWFAGVSNIRGDLVSIVDLRLFVGEPAPKTRRPGVLVAKGRSDQQRLGLLVDEIVGIRRVDERTHEDARAAGVDVAPRLMDYATGSVEVAGNRGLVLDLSRIATAPEIHDFEARV